MIIAILFSVKIQKLRFNHYNISNKTEIYLILFIDILYNQIKKLSIELIL